MRFTNPALLIWGGLIAVPIILYLFRRKPRKVRVSTLIFFKSLAREHQESAWLRRLKRLLSLLLNVLIIAWAVGALARPVVAPPAGSLKSVVILVDRSASMAARDESGRTRLETALARVRQRLAGLPGGVGLMVMAYDRRPEILLPFSLDRREVGRALSALEVRPIEGHAEAALRLASRFAALDTPSSIWHASDAPPPTGEGGGGEADPALQSAETTFEHMCVGLEAPVNVGITAFQLRRLPLEHARFEAFVQVHGAGSEPVEAELEVRVDGRPTALRKMTLEPGGRERLLIPVSAADGKALSLKVSASGDVLPLDDQIHVRIPEVRPVKVVWVSETPDPFTELALGSLAKHGDIEVYQARPGAWPPKEPADVAIFDGWLPKVWPKEPSVIVVDPPGGVGPVQAVRLRGKGLPVDALRATEERHPLLYGVASGRVAVVQTAVLEADGTLQPLWVGPSGPILVAGEVGGQRLVVMAFDPERCEHLPLMASYPLLVGNAIYWSAQPKTDWQGGKNRKTGELVPLEGKSLTWSVPSIRGTSGTTAVLRGRWTELDRIGLWRSDAGETGSASLLSQRETNLVAVEPSVDESDADRAADQASIFRGDLTKLFMWCVLLLLAAESWLFHRHAVY